MEASRGLSNVLDLDCMGGDSMPTSAVAIGRTAICPVMRLEGTLDAVVDPLPSLSGLLAPSGKTPPSRAEEAEASAEPMFVGQVDSASITGSSVFSSMGATQVHAAHPPSARVLRLEDALLETDLGSALLPSVGSLGHNAGMCKPCAFLYNKGCASGVDCQFCHLCGPGEKKRRAKERKACGITVSKVFASKGATEETSADARVLSLENAWLHPAPTATAVPMPSASIAGVPKDVFHVGISSRLRQVCGGA